LTAAAGLVAGAGNFSAGAGQVISAVLDHRQAADRIVFHVDVDGAVLGLAQLLGQTEQVGCIQRGRLLGQTTIQVGVTDDGHAVLYHRLAGLGQFTITTPFRRHVDDDTTRLHALHHLGGEEPWRSLAGDKRGGDDDVHLPGLFRVHLALRLLETLAHHLGVAAATGTFFLVLDFHEFAAQRLDLVGHFGTRIVRAHDGAQTGCGTDRRQTGHAGTGDEYLGRWNLARSRDLAVEEAAKDIRGLDHGAVTGYASLRSQGVHLLGAGKLARQAVDGQHGCLLRSQLLHQLRILPRPDEADQGATFAHQLNLGTRRDGYLEQDVGRSPQPGSTNDDLGSRCAVGIIAAIRPFSGTRFNRDFETQLDELLYDFRHRRNPLFPCVRFPQECLSA